MPNRLAASSSPYLLQHRDNPVDWFEWGREAFAEAEARDVPVLLSVGYSACHWCHVMAHESFEDAETAAVMNELFVNVKVDREERPDVDRIYMDAVQAMTGRGGWPMTVFLTPDGKPFYAGTYFPKDDLHGHPSFRRVLMGVSDAWRGRRSEVTGQADALTAAISESLPVAEHAPSPGLAEAAVAAMQGTFDLEHGGFGGAPKFPQAPNLELLLRAGADEPSTRDFLMMTLERMARGGIYDHVGGGFARYAVDRIWLVPHFEKMLYDNALLARIYARAWQVLGDDDLRRIANETLEYLLRDLRHSDGGFFSAEDADSEGEEGKFYVWSRQELREVLGADAAFAEGVYGVTDGGNFEGVNILNEVEPWAAALPRDRIDDIRRRLLEHRSRRVRPGLDDKVVTAWNGLAIRAFAEAGAIFDSSKYLEAARECAEFVLAALRRPDGRLMRSWRDGSTSVPGFADDYAAMSVGLYALYQATGESQWFEHAETLLAGLRDLFRDPDGGYFATGDDAEDLIARPKNLMDNPAPSDNSLAAEALFIHLGLTGDATAGDELQGIFRAAGALVERHPAAAGHLLAVLHSTGEGPVEVAVTGDETEDLRRVVWGRFRPHVVLATEDRDPPVVPLLEGRVPNDRRPTAHVCEGFVCAMPVHTAEALAEQLDPRANVG